ncbi:MAG TPA: hypothetical protein VHC22_33890 [Pirellulales bacterium]|nr:hypothetical protein [Pirellulales bacterium]
MPRPQFTLRALLVLMLAVAVASAIWVKLPVVAKVAIIGVQLNSLMWWFEPRIMSRPPLTLRALLVTALLVAAFFAGRVVITGAIAWYADWSVSRQVAESSR